MKSKKKSEFRLGEINARFIANLRKATLSEEQLTRYGNAAEEGDALLEQAVLNLSAAMTCMLPDMTYIMVPIIADIETIRLHQQHLMKEIHKTLVSQRKNSEEELDG